ncbi:MAG: PQQ-binding-like beta-propeller repeat protein [Candidatus Hydrogenedentes bacterium]|nr:PQQ-binding-like beta-propeller repeat protein [Candidatus Hydrogenedentota bacterium]
MKDKIISMAPFFVILGIVLVWGFMQGWFSPAPASEEAPDDVAAISGTAEPAGTTTEPVPAAPPAPVETAPAASTPPVPAPTAVPTPLAAAPVVAANEAPATLWSTYHGDANLAGVAAGTLPDAPARLWRFQTSAPLFYGPVSSASMLHFVNSHGEISTVDFTGKKIWSKQLTRKSVNDDTEQNARVDGPLCCFDSTLLVGTMAGTIYAFDAATGNEKWRHEMGSPVLGSITYQPASATQPQARVYVIGQDDGALHCLSFADGTPLWKSEPIDRCDGSPAAGDGVVSFGSCASALHVVSAEDGAILKNIAIGKESQVAGGVAIRGNSVFSGTHAGELIHANLTTGEIVWTNTDCVAEVFTTPAVSTDKVIYGGMDDTVYAVERATGKNVWKFDAKGMPGSAVIVGDKVVVTANGVLYLLALADGKQLWSYEVSDEITPPSIINGMILVGGKDGSLSAFGAAQG